MAEQHTPGPWRAEQDSLGHWRILWPHSQRSCVAAKVFDEADARLMAAAPDLLKYLEFLFQHAEEHADPNGYVELVVRKDEWVQILSAIRKAKGGHP